MGNKYQNNGIVGAMGDNASADNSNFQQNNAMEISDEDMITLRTEFKKLKHALIEDKSTKSLAAAAAISEAQDAAEKNDKAGMLAALKKAGEWSLNIATKIGVPVTIEMLKKSLGLP